MSAACKKSSTTKSSCCLRAQACFWEASRKPGGGFMGQYQGTCAAAAAAVAVDAAPLEGACTFSEADELTESTAGPLRLLMSASNLAIVSPCFAISVPVCARATTHKKRCHEMNEVHKRTPKHIRKINAINILLYRTENSTHEHGANVSQGFLSQKGVRLAAQEGKSNCQMHLLQRALVVVPHREVPVERAKPGNNANVFDLFVGI